MKRLRSFNHQGLEYIRLSDLPFNQLISLKQWISEHEIVDLPSDDGLRHECISYDLYVFWYENFFGRTILKEYSAI